MMYEGIIAAWTALNNTIRRRGRAFTVQKEHILVAESNQVLRRHLVDVLRDGHYRTIEACDGAEAVRIGTRCRRQIHLLMTVVCPISSVGNWQNSSDSTIQRSRSCTSL
jgi:hypothetical protein